MKSRLGFATIALAGFAAVSGFAANASAQNMDQAPGQSPAGPMAPSGPTIGVGNAPYHAVGEDRTEFVRPNGVLLATGGLTLLGSYIPSIVVAASSDHDGDNWLYVPVIGPWVDLGTRGCGSDGNNGTCGINSFDRVALIANGVAQAAGLAQLAWAFVLPQRHLVVTAPQQTGAAEKPTLHVMPGSVGRGNGIVAFGTF